MTYLFFLQPHGVVILDLEINEVSREKLLILPEVTQLVQGIAGI